jgi:outer membrane protein assembly factor BamE (lipoprotein component of BamABCDE complex)
MTRTRPRACRATVTAFALAGLALAATACDAPVKVRGHLPDPETMARITPGEHGRSDVVDMLGSPSTASSFRDRTWYYIGSKEEQIAFFDPDVLKRNVFAITFNEGDTVESTRLYTLADGQPVEPVDRITPTPGRDLTVLQQLLGNLGRFNTAQGGGGAVPSPGPGGPTGPGPSR